MKLFRPVFIVGVCLLLIRLSACSSLAQSPKNLVALYVTSFNPLHQKNVPKLKNAKITDKSDIRKLYSILILMHSRKVPNGSISCPADSGVDYKLRFESKNNHVTITIHPTGCAFIKIPHTKPKILDGKSGQTVMKMLAKDLHVSVQDLRGR